MSKPYPRPVANPTIVVNVSPFHSLPALRFDPNSKSGVIKGPEVDPEAQRPSLAKRLPKIVIVSDDRYFCALVRSYLESAGLCVFVCTTSERAENLFLSRCDMDLWIIDVQALGIEAVYIATRVSELSPGIPLLVIDGPRSDQAPLCALLPESWALLKKPVELLDLLASVHRMLEGGGRRRKKDVVRNAAHSGFA